MSVAYQSVSTTSWLTKLDGESLVITKPTGLTAGDLMVAHLTVVVGGPNNADGWSTPSGWTALTDTAESGNLNSSVRLTVFYKVASSGDAAATDFSFSKSGSQGNTVCGALYRIDGQGSSIQVAADSEIDDLTPTYTNTVTPAFADSLLLFLVSCADAAETVSMSAGSYAITTDNPTWTERYDTFGEIFPDRGMMASATASRSAVTATGNSTMTYTSGSSGTAQNSIGVIIVISPVTNVTIQPSALSVTVSVQAPAISGTANVTVSSALSVTVSVQAPTVTIAPQLWTPQTKSASGVWTNQDKS